MGRVCVIDSQIDALIGGWVWVNR